MEHIAIGKTVEDAIAQALQEKGWDYAEFDIEVLDHGKRGLLKKRPAIVRLTRKEISDRKTLEENVLHFLEQIQKEEENDTAPIEISFEPEPDISSYYWEKDTLILPEDAFQKPLYLHPPRFTTLYQNGIAVNEPFLLDPAVSIVRTVPGEQLEDWSEIYVSEDEMEVSIRLKEETAYECIPVILHYSDRAELHFDEIEKKTIPFSIGDIYEHLQRRGIVYGINFDGIASWVAGKQSRTLPMIIAAGKPKQDGENTQFLPLYGKSDKRMKETTERIDWFALRDVGSVKAGEKILKIVPPTEGHNGFTVYGTPIPAEPGKPLPLTVGPGARKTDDGRYVVAAFDGRPEYKNNQIRVYPVYIHPEDLTLKTGSIKFNGDVIIKGNVTDGLSVEATGNVLVHGSVTYGRIIADGDIHVQQNVIGSHLVAGGNTAFYQTLSYRLEDILSGLQYICQAYAQLSRSAAFSINDLRNTGLGRLIKLLVETKLQNFESSILSLCSFYAEQPGEKPREATAWLERIRQLFIGLGPFQIQSIRPIEELHASGTTLMHTFRQYAAQSSHILSNYVHHSTLQASGKITIIGLGSYNSNLFAGDDITVIGKNGIVRGGKLEAGNKITVQELGGVAEVKTLAYVQRQEGEILADTVYPGVTIQIKQMRHEVKKAGRLAQFKINHKTGKLDTFMLKQGEETQWK